MANPTKADVLDHFGSAFHAAQFMGITRQAVEEWPDGEISERRYRLLLGSYTRRRDRIPAVFRVEPLRGAAA